MLSKLPFSQYTKHFLVIIISELAFRSQKQPNKTIKSTSTQTKSKHLTYVLVDLFVPAVSGNYKHENSAKHKPSINRKHYHNVKLYMNTIPWGKPKLHFVKKRTVLDSKNYIQTYYVMFEYFAEAKLYYKTVL